MAAPFGSGEWIALAVAVVAIVGGIVAIVLVGSRRFAGPELVAAPSVGAAGVPADVTVEEAPVALPSSDVIEVTTAVQTPDGEVAVLGVSAASGWSHTSVWRGDPLVEGLTRANNVADFEISPAQVPWVYGSAAGSGAVIGVGEVWVSAAAYGRAALFRSPDGQEWTHDRAFSFEVGTVAYDVAVVGSRILVVGAGRDDEHRVWFSDDDGRNWDDISDEFGAWGVVIRSVGADEERFYVVGFTVSPRGGYEPYLSSSPDGVDWTDAAIGGIPLGDDGILDDVAAVDGGYVAVGAKLGDDGRQWDTWVFVSGDGVAWVLVPGAGVTAPVDESFDELVVVDGEAWILGWEDEQVKAWRLVLDD